MVKMKNRLKEIRKLRRITQTELSEKANLSQAQIARLEAGLSDISLEQMKLFAKILDVEVWELLPKEMQPNITHEEMDVLRAIRKARLVNPEEKRISSTTKAG